MCQISQHKIMKVVANFSYYCRLQPLQTNMMNRFTSDGFLNKHLDYNNSAGFNKVPKSHESICLICFNTYPVINVGNLAMNQEIKSSHQCLAVIFLFLSNSFDPNNIILIYTLQLHYITLLPCYYILIQFMKCWLMFYTSLTTTTVCCTLHNYMCLVYQYHYWFWKLIIIKKKKSFLPCSLANCTSNCT